MARELRLLCAELVEDSRALDEVFATDITERLSSFTLSGGSRIRPQFLWWALRACGGGDTHTAAALRVAAALELIQTCALIHDDVMDQSAVRRGRPSFHRQLACQYPTAASPRGSGPSSFATSAAVLAGDLALARADDLVAGADLDPAVRTDVLRIWRAMRTEMVAGQYLDLRGQATTSRSAAQAIRTVCLKTARYTVEQPLALGAALAGADEATSTALTAAGRCAGIAFQLRDDLLGVFGDPAVTGKPSGDDIRSGKATYLVALAHTRARATGATEVIDLLRACREEADLSGSLLAAVRDALRSTGAPALVERRIARLVRACERAFAAAGLHGLAARRLAELLERVASPSALTASPAPTGREGGVR
ncbi:polyprenyl synthetase family protein [Streptomyces sp. G-G2]|uniref:polyprenyl synthetase family protein n=1 Tax=Streptomyces sp. G-G2 TaxID=3046201 RepID=UPI0024BB0572|nr:polyprenyl synthetase family protein [Streptomyces sp. G-G2]MDJ0381978.1 polyprenyl synthetase family protein [Streptomyces sp. G-G2]